MDTNNNTMQQLKDSQTQTTEIIKNNKEAREEQKQWLLQQQSDAAVGRVAQLLRNNPGASDAEIDAVATGGGSSEGDLRAWQKLNSVRRGTGAFFGTLNKPTSYGLRQAALQYIDKEDKAAAAREAAEAATADNANTNNKSLGTFKDSNGVDYSVPDLRGLFKEMGDYLQTLGRNPQNLDRGQAEKYQQLYNQLRTKLGEAGVDVSNMRELKVDDIVGKQTLGGVGELLGLLNGGQGELVENIFLANGVSPDANGGISFPRNKTWDELQAERNRQKEQIDLMIQQRELQRQYARTGLADIAAVIGDMMKAAGGAPVTARDYSNIYNNLTAQQKANYDAYRTRIDKINQDEKEARIRQEELARRERERLEDKQWQDRMMNKQFAYQDKDFNRRNFAENERFNKQLKAAADQFKKKLELEETKALAEAAKLSYKNLGDSPLIIPGKDTLYFDKTENKTIKSVLYGRMKKIIDDGNNEKLGSYLSFLETTFGGIVDTYTKQAAVLDAMIGSGLLTDAMLNELYNYAVEASTKKTNGEDKDKDPVPPQRADSSNTVTSFWTDLTQQ